ncbi:MAG: DUF4242 domain-containing protein [Tabrizicola sp.]|jgi:hypothetical protein|nr:DUF4242 domain-containing protein [Tabrizicola sp.]
MKTFLIERDLEGISMPDLHGLVAASQRQVARMLEEGDLVHYLGSTFLPGEGLCYCLYQAKDASVLAGLNTAARLPAKRIVDAIALSQDH